MQYIEIGFFINFYILLISDCCYNNISKIFQAVLFNISQESSNWQKRLLKKEKY